MTLTPKEVNEIDIFCMLMVRKFIYSLINKFAVNFEWSSEVD